jgi:hypothetical protein
MFRGSFYYRRRDQCFDEEGRKDVANFLRNMTLIGGSKRMHVRVIMRSLRHGTRGGNGAVRHQ